MIKINKCILLASTMAALFLNNAYAQQDATIKEYQKTFKTYPFSDPNPVPNLEKIYPYFRYDGFSDQSKEQSWKVVELDNDYISVQILPQIGGKIWTAIDKRNGKPFIYENDVIKFRDIAMRGAWTSGGIESNFGIIGHTPTVGTPIDYMTRKNPDGSVSCIIGALDLLSRTRWNIEIRLPKDKAYFITRTYWHNTTPIEEPYYSWMNLAVKTRDSLEFVNPGTNYIGHDGSSHLWPTDTSNGRNLSIYGQNNFGSSKSYHIFGTYSNYYGAYWEQEDFGMIHYAEREDKPGKKVFMWALSGQGKIWEDLLTDHGGQYAEIQSGRLFTQNMLISSLTPFKQVGFSPYQTDYWTEYWYPFSHTGGARYADLNGVFDVTSSGDSLTVRISPVSRISDTLHLYDQSGTPIYSAKLDLMPLEPYAHTIALKSGAQFGKLSLQGTILWSNQNERRKLDRPTEPFPDFNWESAYGLYLMGRDEARYRDYATAEVKIRQSLQKDGSFIPALTEMAFLKYRSMQYDSAFYYARQALSIDTYNPGANYYYGLAAAQLNKYYDAMDGFEIACLTAPFRSAAFTEMSLLQFQKQDYEKAYAYATRSLENNSGNMTSLKLQMLAARLLGNDQQAKAAREKILQIDPLNYFTRFEDYWAIKDSEAQSAFTGSIRNELPAENYLELAIWYHKLGLNQEAEALLNMAPQNNEIAYWQAYLHKDMPDAAARLQVAEQGDPKMIFPFREETAAVMQWASSKSQDWKPRYYLALIKSFRNDSAAASQLLHNISEEVPFAPFYVTRARLADGTDTAQQLADLNKATQLMPDQWRYTMYLGEMLIRHQDNAKAMQVLQAGYKADPKNYMIGMPYVHSLMLNNRYAEAEKVLSGLDILPYEGATSGRRLYRQIKLMLAVEAAKKGNYRTALKKIDEAELWPKSLGVGKPFDNLIHNDLENELRDMVNQAKKGGKPDFGSIQEKIEAITGRRRG